MGVYEMIPGSKRQRPDNDIFTITVKGKKNHDILVELRNKLEMADQLITPADRERFMQQRRQNE